MPTPVRASDQTPSERADARANRLRVLEAARRAFAEHGLAAEVKDIAEIAGVGVGTIYRGFGSKMELLEAVAAEASTGLEAIFAEAEGRDDAAAAVRELLPAAVHHVESYGWLLQLLLSGQVRISVGTATDKRADLDCRLRLLLERGVSAGALRADLPVGVAAVLIQGVFLVLMSAGDRNAAASLTGDELAAGLLALLSKP